MSETNGKGIYVVGVEVESLHRLKFASVKLLPGGGLVKVTGKNGAGKTSLLRAIREAMGGAGEVPPVAVNEEADDRSGFVRLELSNGFTVTRSFTEANPKGYLKVVGPDGGVHKQGRLDEWLGSNHDFDVLAFFGLKAERQREILLGLGSDPELAEKLEVVRSMHRSLYSDRTPHISEQQRCRRVREPEGERPEAIDTSVEMKRQGELLAIERDRQDAFRDAKAADGEATEARKEVAYATEAVSQAEAAMAAAENALGAAREEHAEAERLLEEAYTAAEGAKSEAEAISDPSDELEIVRGRLNQASEVERALQPWGEYDRAQASFSEATNRVDELTAQMATLKDEERELIAGAGIPVEGLTFEPETAEPLLNGRPLEVASGGERIRMAVSVAIAVDPELRVCLVDEANDLDLDALEALDGLAEEHDFQVWGCRLGIEGPGEVIVENGEARSVEPAMAAS